MLDAKLAHISSVLMSSCTPSATLDTMSTELTTSLIARKNILNNRYALQQLENHLALGGLEFEGQTLFTKPQVASILDIDERTIDRYLSSHGEELTSSGYRLLRGKHLKNIRLIYTNDIDVVRINPKASILGVFSFRALLNLAMLVTESARAKAIRSRMLDIVLDVIAQKVGGQTKYINQRDQDYLLADAESNPFLKSAIEDARIRMSSRDLGFRDALHHKLKHYIQSIPEADFERFLGEKSRDLQAQLADPETLNVLKRLKER